MRKASKKRNKAWETYSEPTFLHKLTILTIKIKQIMKKILLIILIGFTFGMNAQVIPSGEYKLTNIGVNGNGTKMKGKVSYEDGILDVNFKMKSIPNMTFDIQSIIDNPENNVSVLKEDLFLEVLSADSITYRLQKEQFTGGYSFTQIITDPTTKVTYSSTISFK